jgi:murein DD-endopeptidase MepM/ murein hydrolase activator NlpD
LLLGLGSIAGLLVFGRKQPARSENASPFAWPGSALLGSPVEVAGAPTVTPNGHFGAPRAGPPVHTHQGIDLAAPPGSRVLAVGDGEIVRTDPGLGRVVRKLRLARPSAWGIGRRRVEAIVYADLGKPLVQPGERVRRGDPIALVWPHGFVHFAIKEVRRSGEVFFDPREAGFSYRLASGQGVA